MQKNCSIHENRNSQVCFYQGCTQPFLCRYCFKEHPDSHEAFVMDLIDLYENKKWLDDKEAQKQLEVKKIENIFQERDELRAMNENNIKEIVSFTKELLTQIEQRWTQELNAFMTSGQESEEMSHALRKEMDSLGLYNFKSDDIYKAIEKVKKFDDDVIPRVQVVRDRAQDALSKMRIGQDRMQVYKDAVTKIFDGVHIEDLFVSRPFGKIERLDERNSEEIENLGKEKQSLTLIIQEKDNTIADLRNRVVSLEGELHHINELKDKLCLHHSENDKLNAILIERTKEIDSLRTKIIQLSDFENKYNTVCKERENISKENDSLRTKIIQLSDFENKYNTVCKEREKISKENDSLRIRNYELSDFKNKYNTICEEIEKIRKENDSLNIINNKLSKTVSKKNFILIGIVIIWVIGYFGKVK